MSGMTIIIDEATPLLSRVENAATAKGLALVGGRAVGTLLRDHLVALNSDRHRYGRNYYAQAARSVHVQAVDTGAAVSITQVGFRQRLLGGRITAGSNGSGKIFLTIPAPGVPDAFSETASEHNDLTLGRRVNPKTGHLQWCLIRNASTPISIRHRRQKDGTMKTKILAGDVQGGEVVFWLVHSVNQKADPSVLPSDDKISAAATAAITAELATLALRSALKGGNN
jgi:hypothetical protein